MRVVCTAALGLALGSGDSPVDKVVTLIEDMKTKIEAEGEQEQKDYDKYACWCEATTKEKARDVADGRSRIMELGSIILGAKGKLGQLNAEIAELEKDVAANRKSQEKATALRENENKAYQAQKAEMASAIGSLEKAILVLNGAGTGADLLAVMSQVQSAIADVPTHKISSSKVQLMSKFMSNPTAFLQTGGQYAPQSGTVLGILKDMYDTFTVNFEGNDQEEGAKQRAYEDLMQTKIKAYMADNDELIRKQTEAGQEEKVVAEGQAEREDLIAQVAADTKFFKDTTTECKAKAAEWTERVRLRTEELHGIEKALEILTSDEAKEIFEKSIDKSHKSEEEAGFIQSSASGVARSKAIAALSKVTKVSPKGSLVAALTKLRTGGMFDDVIKAVDTEIKGLKEEGKEDVKNRDKCIEKETKTTNKKEDYVYKVKKDEEKIEELNDKKDQLEEDITTITDKISDHKDVMEQNRVDRGEAHDDYMKSITDDEAAVELLEKAIKTLKEFYKNNKSLLQRAEPKPDDRLSKKDTQKQANDGIVAILTQIKENVENEIKEAQADDRAEQDAYEKQTADDRVTLEAMKTRKSDLQKEKAQVEEDITDKEEDKTNHETARDDKQAYLDVLEPGCAWIRTNFAKRAKLRAEEIEGLMEVKNYLAGMPTPTFLQRK
mmetsp:Transcript_6597/g.15767  ORF Transcript_6597/g.15767 Transcript_6597/m.15767 type:complete len:665 (+) Transcript_6597:74-2068(+)